MSEPSMRTFSAELRRLAADLHEVAENVGPYINSAVQQTAVSVKNSARDKVRGRKYFKGAAQAIDYELSTFHGFGASVLKAEIGYNKDRPGAGFGHIVEFGAPRAKAWMTVKTKAGKLIDVPVPGSPARPLPPGSELQAALQEHEAAFQENIEDQLDKAMRAKRL